MSRDDDDDVEHLLYCMRIRKSSQSCPLLPILWAIIIRHSSYICARFILHSRHFWMIIILMNKVHVVGVGWRLCANLYTHYLVTRHEIVITLFASKDGFVCTRYVVYYIVTLRDCCIRLRRIDPRQREAKFVGKLSGWWCSDVIWISEMRFEQKFNLIVDGYAQNILLV